MTDTWVPHTDLSVVAEQLLTTLEARWDADDVPDAEALPAKRYIAHGQQGRIAADDKRQDPRGSLIVFMPGIVSGHADGASNLTGNKATTDGALHGSRATFQYRLLRPHPVQDEQGNPPTPEKIRAASLVQMRDATRLLDAVGMWRRHLPIHLAVTVGAIEPDGPSGKLAGWRGNVTLGPI